jgi:protein-disulfide isomerase
MASRTKQKEAARARRLAEERAAAERAQRARRTRMLGGVLALAVVIVGVAIAVSISGGNSSSSSKVSAAAKATSSAAACKAAGATSTCAAVESLLSGIPQSGTTLGSPNAKVTVTEFGDLECPICKDFATSTETQLIAKDVRSGKVKLVYRSLETATGGAPDPNIFPVQQAAAYAAGAQDKAWNYILLFYHEQGQEATAYVNQNYLNGLAHQVPGLNFSQWSNDSKNPRYTAQVTTDEQAAAGQNFNSTPTITIQGPKGQAQPFQTLVDYPTLESAIKSVS